MIEGLNKPLRHCTLSELHRHSDSVSVKLSQAQRKYSVGLLEEAYRLSKKVGLSQAARQAGVNINSLKHYRQIRQREEGIARHRVVTANTIPDEKKKLCLSVALDLHRRGFSRGMRHCWIEAGRMVGVNGRSVEFQYVRGIWKP